jgi:putative FmdB family regulatory protein
MPIYEYRCRNCEHEFEKIQKISDRPVRTCPACGGRTEKLVSRSAFVLKGGGWYAQGYSRSGKPASAGSDAGESGTEKKKAKTDKKPKAAKGSTGGSD